VVPPVLSGLEISAVDLVSDVKRTLHRAVGQRSSIAFMISSAQRTASAMALTVAGTLFPPSN
jgi:hypothetical protein